jgi:hypothetical protein
LKPEEVYEFIVVAVDGDTMKDSDIVEIEASSTGILSNLIIGLFQHVVKLS